MFVTALGECDRTNDPVCHFVKSDVLMRKYNSPKVSVDGDWAVKHHIAVTKLHHAEISRVLETRLTDHLGMNDTINFLTISSGLISIL